ncbi:hypothetical protein MJO29_009381 [Puccinia striiformis f. sp. tritici]|nr:hypothetical protein MJO29_009381 [Puccinia striiformis f. sp. tritici]
MLELSRKKQESFESFADHMVMGRKLTGMDEEALEYFKEKRKLAWERCCCNYTEKEDVQLCVSWVEISKDPKKGTNQILNSFWDPVANHYATHLPGSCQTLKSLQSRWGDHIQKEVNKFLGCVHQVDNLNPSGKTDSNQLQLSPKLNKYCCTLEKTKERSKPNSKPKNSASEIQILNVMSATNAADSQAPWASDIKCSRDNISSFPTRTIGRKCAKADKAAALTAQRNSDNIEKMAQAHPNIAALLPNIKLLSLTTLHQAEKAIMYRDTSQMSGPMKMNYESEQARILARIAQEDAATANRSTSDNTNSPDISGKS